MTDAHADYAHTVAGACAAAGLRATVDGSGEKMGALIRRAKLAKVPTSWWWATTMSRRERPA